MKQVEADRLLYLHRVASRAMLPDVLHPHIAAAPEIGHILLLGSEKLRKPVSNYAIQRPLRAAAEFFRRSRPGRVIDHIFGEFDGVVWLSLDRESDLAEVLALRNLVRAGA